MKKLSFLLAFCGLFFAGCSESENLYLGNPGNGDDESADDGGDTENESKKTDKDDKKTGNQDDLTGNEDDPAGNHDTPSGNEDDPNGNEDDPNGNHDDPTENDNSCGSPKVQCGAYCLDLSELHLKSCFSCDDGFCDADSNLSNGCEISLASDNDSHCGSCAKACGEGRKCENGECKSTCPEGSAVCNGECINLDEKHLASCDACAEDYCDADDNLNNGCEVSVMSDADNCGSCGHVCEANERCKKGQCARRAYVMFVNERYENEQKVYDSNHKFISEIPTYSLVHVMESSGGWSRISMNNDYASEDMWIKDIYLLDAGDQYLGRKAVDLAETYLYNVKDMLCTYDFMFRTEPPMLPTLRYDNGSYDKHCADFVQAIMRYPGVDLISNTSEDLVGVKQLSNYCKSGKDGYRVLQNPEDAKPGDIWTGPNNNHSEIIIGYYARKKVYLMIGSNNDSNSQRVFSDSYGCNEGNVSPYYDPECGSALDCEENQRVTYHPRTDSLQGTVYTRQ